MRQQNDDSFVLGLILGVGVLNLLLILWSVGRVWM
jgi:hypothetical protein